MRFPIPKQSNIVGSDLFVKFKFDNGEKWGIKKLLLHVLRYDIEPPYIMIGICNSNDDYKNMIFIIDTDSSELPILNSKGNDKLSDISTEGYCIENPGKTYNIDYDFPEVSDINISYFVFKFPIDNEVKSNCIYIVADERDKSLKFITKKDILADPENLCLVITTWRRVKYDREQIAFIINEDLLKKYTPVGMKAKEDIDDDY